MDFTYRLEAHIIGRTALGRYQELKASRIIPATIEEEGWSMNQPKCVSTQKEAYIYDSVYEMLQSSIEETALRYGLIMSTVQIKSYTVSADHPDVVLLFNDSKKDITENRDALVYGYIRQLDTAPPPVSNISYTLNGDIAYIEFDVPNDILGIRLYNENNELVEQYDSDITRITIQNIEKGKIYYYSIKTYHRKEESAPVYVQIYIPNDDVDVYPKDTIEYFVEYTNEVEPEKIEVFQSGVGGEKDLEVVALNESKDTLPTSFSYDIEIIALKKKKKNFFPKKLVSYRFVSYNVYGVIVDQTEWKYAYVDGDNESVDGKKDVEVICPLNATENAVYVIEVKDTDNKVISYFESTNKNQTSTPYGKAKIASKPDSYISIEKNESSVLFQERKTRHSNGFEKIIEWEEEIPHPFRLCENPNEVDEFKIIITPVSPSLEIIEKDPIAVGPSEHQYMRFGLIAKVKNMYLLPWQVSMRAGYFYDHQKEYYLFANDEVTCKKFDYASPTTISFIYQIHATALISGTERSFIFQDKKEIIANGLWQPLHTKTIDEIMTEEIERSGFSIQDVSQIQYKLYANPLYPIILSSRDGSRIDVEYEWSIGKGVPCAKSKEILPSIVYSKNKGYPVDYEIICSPAPKNSPVIVKDRLGELRRVYFFTEKGESSLANKETVYINEYGVATLSYTKIKKETVVIRYEVENGDIVEDRIDDEKWVLSGHYLKPNMNLPVYTPLEVSYEIERSFIVRVDEKENMCYIKMTDDVSLFDDGSVEVYYEVEEKGLYVDEIDLHPLYSTESNGYVFLSSDIYSCAKLEVHSYADSISTKEDDTCFIIRGYNELGNPCGKQKIKCYKNGVFDQEIELNEHGVGYVWMKAPIENIRVENDSGVYVEKSINTAKEIKDVWFSLETSTPAIHANGGEVKIKAKLLNENYEPLANKDIQITSSFGVLNERTKQTNSDGEAEFQLTITDVPVGGDIFIYATYEDKIAQGKVSVIGYRHYTPDYFIDEKHWFEVQKKEQERLYILMFNDKNTTPYLAKPYQLSDVTDKQEAKRNLGIVVSDVEPESPQPMMIWIEKE